MKTNFPFYDLLDECWYDEDECEPIEKDWVEKVILQKQGKDISHLSSSSVEIAGVASLFADMFQDPELIQVTEKIVFDRANQHHYIYKDGLIKI